MPNDSGVEIARTYKTSRPKYFTCMYDCIGG